MTTNVRRIDDALQRTALADFEKYIEKEFEKIFDMQRLVFENEVMTTPDNINEILDRAFILTKKDMESVVFHAWTGLVTIGIRRFKSRLKEAKKVEYPELPQSFRLDNPEAIARLWKVAAARVVEIDKATKLRIKSIISAGRESGKSYDEIAKDIIAEYNTMAVGRPQEHIRSRAHMIAVTETADAYGYANFTSANEIGDTLGIKMEKSWDNTNDDRVCDDCDGNANDGWIAIDEPFSSGVDREPAHPACRCAVLYRAVGAVT